jgi:hypothetical protein
MFIPALWFNGLYETGVHQLWRITIMPVICEGLPEIVCDGLPCTDISTGFRLVVNPPAVEKDPVLVGESEVDEAGVSLYGSVVRDGGVYRMWYQAWSRDWPTSSTLEDVVAVACVESDDGLTWRRPKYGVLEAFGNKANHLTDLPFHSPCVYLDPAALASARFRAFGYSDPRRLAGKYSHKINRRGYYTAYSADGLHWHFDSPDPVWEGSDVITAAYDPKIRGATVLLKRGRLIAGLKRRAFLSAEWIEGKSFEPVSALVPDEYDDQQAKYCGFNSADYYGVGLMPTEGPTIGFLWNFRHQLPMQCIGDSGRIDLSIVYQLERGGRWFHVSGRPDWLTADQAPEWARGALYTASSPIDVGNETWLYFTGTVDRHGFCGQGVDYAQWVKTVKDLRGFAKIGLARWPRNRIMGYYSYLSNVLTLAPMGGRAEGLTLNAVTQKGGGIRVALTYEDREPIRGYGFEDCEVIAGDHLEAPVRWKQNRPWPRIPEKRGLNVRVEITNGTLFAFEFKNKPVN